MGVPEIAPEIARDLMGVPEIAVPEIAAAGICRREFASGI